MSFLCEPCNKNYKSYQSLWNHNNKFHKNNKLEQPNKKIQNNICNNCNKKFTTKKNLIYHTTNVCHSSNEDTSAKIIESNNKKTSMLEKQIEKLHQKIQVLEAATYISKATINGNVNNGTINNNIIYINKIGNENISELTDKEIRDIFDKKIESLIKFIQVLNFNERLPSNHNFCSTSLEGQYLKIYNTDKSNEENERKKYFFEDLLSRSVNKMEELYKKYKNKFNKNKQSQIEDDIQTLKDIKNKDMNDSLLKEMLKKLNLLSYNYKEIVLNTWNNYNTINKNTKLKTFEEDLESNDDKKVVDEIESLFIKEGDKIIQVDEKSDVDSESEKILLIPSKKNNKSIIL